MFEKDCFKIEKLIHRKLPLLAKAKLESLNIPDELLDKKLMYMSNEQFKRICQKLRNL